jgi:hypothetical protein
VSRANAESSGVQVRLGLAYEKRANIQLELGITPSAARNVEFLEITEANMNKTNDIKENFAALLRDSLRTRFGHIPSAAVVAREFNLRAYDTPPISQESARRWIRGVSLPEEQRLRVLVNWLNLDFNAALRPGRDLNGHSLSIHSANGHDQGNGHVQGNGHALGNGHVQGNGEARWQVEKPCSSQTQRTPDLAALVQHLNNDQRQVLESFLKAAFKNLPPPL